jgi:hypothetical protein
MSVNARFISGFTKRRAHIHEKLTLPIKYSAQVLNLLGVGIDEGNVRRRAQQAHELRVSILGQRRGLGVVQ